MTLTHFGASGEARMVDVGDKPITLRTATAEATVHMRPETLAIIQSGTTRKGDVLGTARLAGIMAAKQTSALIPLCHPLPIDAVELTLTPAPPDTLRIEATVRTTGRTGVEMEALTAASVAALTIYDMCKSTDRGMIIQTIRLLAKSGGKSGTFTAK